MNKLLVGLKRSFSGPKSAPSQSVGIAGSLTAQARDEAGPGAKVKINRLTGSIAAAPRRARAAAAASLAVLALATTALAAPSASAASTTPNDFSSRIADNPSAGWWADDCWVQIGFVFDPYPAASGYHHLGGVRVTNCLSTHSFIDVTVALYYSDGSRWWQWGSGSHGTSYNSAGWGYGISGIFKTPSYCVGAYRANRWIVGATLRTERGSWTVFSQNPVSDPYGGC